MFSSHVEFGNEWIVWMSEAWVEGKRKGVVKASRVVRRVFMVGMCGICKWLGWRE